MTEISGVDVGSITAALTAIATAVAAYVRERFDNKRTQAELVKIKETSVALQAENNEQGRRIAELTIENKGLRAEVSAMSDTINKLLKHVERIIKT